MIVCPHGSPIAPELHLAEEQQLLALCLRQRFAADARKLGCSKKMRAKMQLSDICEPPQAQSRGSIMVRISACHAEDPGSIPGRGVASLPYALVFSSACDLK